MDLFGPAAKLGIFSKSFVLLASHNDQSLNRFVENRANAETLSIEIARISPDRIVERLFTTMA